MKRSTLFALAIFIFSTGYSKEFPGYYIKNNGDSIRCFFKFNDWEITPDAVVVTANNAIFTLTPAEITGFGIDGYGHYKSAQINYHKSNYTLLNAPDNLSDSITTKHAFLKIMVRGKYNLFELAESSKIYLFIQQEDDEVTELVYRVIRKNMDVEEDNAYRYQLFNIFSNERIAHEYSNDITKSSYTSRSIIPLIKKLNTRVTGIKYPGKKDEMSFDVFIGGIDNKFPTAFDGMYSGGNKFDPAKSISGGASFLYFIPSKFKRFAVGVSAGYNSFSQSYSKTDSIVDFTSIYNHRTTTFTEHYSFSNKVIMLNIFGIGILNAHDKVKVYVKGGFNTNLVIGGEKSVNTAYTSVTKGVRNGNIPVDGSSEGVKKIEMNGAYYSLNGGLGINTGNHKLEFLYYTPGVLDADYAFKVKMMGLYYYFTILKSKH
jgi:hypothetical protein